MVHHQDETSCINSNNKHFYNNHYNRRGLTAKLEAARHAHSLFDKLLEIEDKQRHSDDDSDVCEFNCSDKKSFDGGILHRAQWNQFVQDTKVFNNN